MESEIYQLSESVTSQLDVAEQENYTEDQKPQMQNLIF